MKWLAGLGHRWHHPERASVVQLVRRRCRHCRLIGLERWWLWQHKRAAVWLRWYALIHDLASRLR